MENLVYIYLEYHRAQRLQIKKPQIWGFLLSTGEKHVLVTNYLNEHKEHLKSVVIYAFIVEHNIYNTTKG